MKRIISIILSFAVICCSFVFNTTALAVGETHTHCVCGTGA